MTDELVRIWKFETAPEQFRLLASEFPNPRWVVQIPKSLVGQDLDAEIRLRAGSTPLQKVITAQGDVVYFGVSELAPLMATVLAAGDRPVDPPRTGVPELPNRS